MNKTASNNRISSNDIAGLMQRICEHLGIAFSANKVFPSLADLNQDGLTVTEVEELNAIGKHFGIRFREMSGSMRDLTQTVSDAGMVLAKTMTSGDSSNAILVIASQSRSRFLVHEKGEDKTVARAIVRKRLNRDHDKNYHWLLIQPILAAENASRFHCQSGTQSQPLKPLRRFVSLLKPEAQDVRVIFIFSFVIGILSLTLPLALEAVVNTIAYGRALQPLIILSLIVLVLSLIHI